MTGSSCVQQPGNDWQWNIVECPVSRSGWSAELCGCCPAKVKLVGSAIRAVAQGVRAICVLHRVLLITHAALCRMAVIRHAQLGRPPLTFLASCKIQQHLFRVIARVTVTIIVSSGSVTDIRSCCCRNCWKTKPEIGEFRVLVELPGVRELVVMISSVA